MLERLGQGFLLHSPGYALQDDTPAQTSSRKSLSNPQLTNHSNSLRNLLNFGLQPAEAQPWKEIGLFSDLSVKERFDHLLKIFGFLVEPLFRDGSGSLSLNLLEKMRGQTYHGLRNFLIDQALLNDGIAFGSPFEKILANPLYDKIYIFLNIGLFDINYNYEMEHLELAIIKADAEAYAAHLMTSADGRDHLRRLINSAIDRDLRIDLIKGIARAAQNFLEADELTGITDNLLTVDYFNWLVGKHQLAGGLKAAQDILNQADRFYQKLQTRHQDQQSKPQTFLNHHQLSVWLTRRDQASALGGVVGELAGKLAQVWIWAADPYYWEGTNQKLRSYIQNQVAQLYDELLQIQNDESRLHAFNNKLAAFINSTVADDNYQATDGWNHFWASTTLIDHIHELAPTLRSAFDELVTLKDQIHHTQNMGYTLIRSPLTSSHKLTDNHQQIITGLDQLKRSLCYAYKQHKFLSRAGSTLLSTANASFVGQITEDVFGSSDTQDITAAIKVLEATINRLQQGSSLQVEVKNLMHHFKKGGVLYQASIAAEMDGSEQLIGLIQTVALIGAMNVTTVGALNLLRIKGPIQALQIGLTSKRILRAGVMGAGISTAENALAVTSDEARQAGADRWDSWLKDAAATAIAMSATGLIPPSGLTGKPWLLGFDKVAKRYVHGFVTGAGVFGRLFKGVGHYARDVSLEFSEEYLDFFLRTGMDGEFTAMSKKQAFETLVITGTGGLKVKAVSEAVSEQPTKLDRKITQKIFAGSKDEVEGEKGKPISGTITDETEADEGSPIEPLLAELHDRTQTILRDSQDFNQGLDEWSEELDEITEGFANTTQPLQAPLAGRNIADQLVSTDPNQPVMKHPMAGLTCAALAVHFSKINDFVGQKIYQDLEILFWELQKGEDIDLEKYAGEIDANLELDSMNPWLVAMGIWICQKQLADEDFKSIRKLIIRRQTRYQGFKKKIAALDTQWTKTNIRSTLEAYAKDKLKLGALEAGWSTFEDAWTAEKGISLLTSFFGLTLDTLSGGSKTMVGSAKKVRQIYQTTQAHQTQHQLETALYYGDYRGALFFAEERSAFWLACKQLISQKQQEQMRQVIALESPPRLAAHAVERVTDLRALEQKLKTGRVVSIEGISGSGKTYLAAQLAHKHRGQRPQFWYQFRHAKPNVALVLEHLEKFVTTHHHLIAEDEQRLTRTKSQAQKIELLAKALRAKPCSLFFDDFHHVMEDPEAAEVFETLVQHGIGKTTIVNMVTTTRRDSNWLTRVNAETLETPGVNRQEAKAILKKMAVADQISQDEFNELYEKTGGLPKAIALFGGALHQGRKARELIDALPKGQKSAVIGFLFDDIYKKLPPDQKRILGYLSIFRGPIHPEVIVEMGVDETTDIKNHLDSLKEAYLVDEQANGDIELHASLRELAQARVDHVRALHLRAAEGMIEAPDNHTQDSFPQYVIEIGYHCLKADAVMDMIDVIEQLPIDTTFDIRSNRIALKDIVEKALATVKDDDKLIGYFSYLAARIERANFNHEKAAELFLQAATYRSEPEYKVERLRCYSNAAESFGLAGNHQRSEDCYRVLLPLLDDDDIEINNFKMSALGSLSRAKAASGEWRAAINLNLRATRLAEALPKPHGYYEIATCLNERAQLFVRMKQYDKALEIFDAAKSVGEKITHRGDRDHFLRTYYRRYAKLLTRLDRDDEAYEIYENTLVPYAQERHLDYILAESYFEMGYIHFKRKQNQEASHHFKQALKYAVLSDDQRIEIYSLIILATIKFFDDDFSTAYEEMIAAYRRLDSDSLDRLGVMAVETLADIFQKIGLLKESRELVLMVQDVLKSATKRIRDIDVRLDIQEDQSGVEAIAGFDPRDASSFPPKLPHNPYFEAKALLGQAMKLPESGFQEAEEKLDRVVAMAKSIGNVEIIQTASLGLMEIAARQGNMDKVKEVAKKAIAIATSLQNPYALAHLTASLANALISQSKDIEETADDLTDTIIPLWEDVIDLADPETDSALIASSYYNLGYAENQLDNPKAARVHLEMCEEILQEQDGTKDKLLQVKLHMELAICDVFDDLYESARAHYLEALAILDEGSIPIPVSSLRQEIEIRLKILRKLEDADATRSDKHDPVHIDKRKDEFQGSRDDVEGKKGDVVSGRLLTIDDISELLSILPETTRRLIEGDSDFKINISKWSEELIELQKAVQDKDHPLWAPLVARNIAKRLEISGPNIFTHPMAGIVFGALANHYKAIDDLIGQRLYEDLQSLYWEIQNQDQATQWNRWFTTIDRNLEIDPTHPWWIQAGLVAAASEIEKEQVAKLKTALEAKQKTYQKLKSESDELDTKWRASTIKDYATDYLARQFDTGSLRGTWNLQRIYTSVQGALDLAQDVVETLEPTASKMLAWANQLIGYAEKGEQTADGLSAKDRHLQLQTALYYGDYRGALLVSPQHSALHHAWHHLAQTKINQDLQASIRFQAVPLLEDHNVERTKALAELEQTLQTERMVSIEGIRGCGKTTLAVQLAKRFEKTQPVFWYRFRKNEKPDTSAMFAELACFIENHHPTQAGLLNKVRNAKNHDQKATLLAKALKVHPTPLFLDDFQEVMKHEEAANAVASLVGADLGDSSVVNIVTTTSEQSHWLKRLKASSWQTQGIDRGEARTLLDNMGVSAQVTDNDLNLVHARTGGLPQALILFGKALSEPRTTAQQLIATMPEGSESEVLGYLFELVYEKLTPQQQQALHYLSLLRLPVSEDLLVDIDDGQTPGFKTALAGIKKSFLVSQPHPNSYELHDALKTLARRYVDNAKELHGQIADSFDKDLEENEPQYKLPGYLRRNIEFAHHSLEAERYVDTIWGLDFLFSFSLQIENTAELAEEILQKFDDDMVAQLPAISRARYYALQGDLASHNDRYEVCENYYLQGATTYQEAQKFLEAARFHTVAANMATTSKAYDRARQHLAKAKPLAKISRDKKVVGQILIEQAKIARYQEQTDEALRAIRDAKAIGEQLASRGIIISALLEEARLYRGMDLKDQAKACYEEALKGNTPQIRIGLWNVDFVAEYASLLAEMGRPDEAIAILTQIIEAESSIMSPQRLAASYYDIAGIYFDQKDFAKSKDYLDQAIELNPLHDNLVFKAHIHNRRADCLFLQGYHQAAHHELKQALEYGLLEKDKSNVLEAVGGLTLLCHLNGAFGAAVLGHQWIKKYGAAIDPAFTQEIAESEKDIATRIRVSGQEIATPLPLDERADALAMVPDFPTTLNFNTLIQTERLVKQAKQEEDTDTAIKLYFQSAEQAQKLGLFPVIGDAVNAIRKLTHYPNPTDQHINQRITALQLGFNLGVKMPDNTVIAKFGTLLSATLKQQPEATVLKDEAEQPLSDADKNVYLYEVLETTLAVSRTIENHDYITHNAFNMGILEFENSNYQSAQDYFNESLRHVDHIRPGGPYPDFAARHKTKTYLYLGRIAKHQNQPSTARNHFQTALKFCAPTATTLIAQIQTELDSLNDDTPDPDDKITKTKNETQGSRDDVEGKKGDVVSGEIADELAEFEAATKDTDHPLRLPLAAKDMADHLASSGDPIITHPTAMKVFEALTSHYETLDDLVGKYLYENLQTLYTEIQNQDQPIDWDKKLEQIDRWLKIDPTNIWMIDACLLGVATRLEQEETAIREAGAESNEIKRMKASLEAKQKAYKELKDQADQLDRKWRDAKIKTYASNYLAEKFETGSIRGVWNLQRVYGTVKGALTMTEDVLEKFEPTASKLLAWANKLIGYAEKGEETSQEYSSTDRKLVAETALYYGDYRGALLVSSTDSALHHVWHALAENKINQDLLAAVTYQPIPLLEAHNVERAEALAELEKKLESSRLVSIEGIRGCGKSTLAIQLAKRFEQKGPVFWYRFYKNEKPDAAHLFTQLAYFIETHHPDQVGLLNLVRSSSDNKLKVKLLGQALKAHPTPIFLDDFQEVMKHEEAADAFATLIQEDLGDTAVVNIVTTATERSNWLIRAKAESWKTKGVNRKEAREILINMGVSDKVSDAQLDVIYQRTGGLPQAIALFGNALIEPSSWDAQALIDNMPEGDSSVTLGYLFEKIYTQLSDQQKTLLTYLSLLRIPAPVDFLVKLEAGQAKGIRLAIGGLLKSFLLNQTQKGAVELHGSIKTLARRYIDNPTELHYQIARNINDNPNEFINNNITDALRINVEMVYHLIAAQKYEDAISLLNTLSQQSLDIRTTIYLIEDLVEKLDDSIVAKLSESARFWLYYVRGSILTSHDRYKEAETLLKLAALEFEKAQSYDGGALLYMAASQAAMALEAPDRVSSHLKKAEGLAKASDNKPALAQVLLVQANFALRQNETNEALGLLIRARSIGELTSSTGIICAVYEQEARLYDQIGLKRQALSCYKKAFQISAHNPNTSVFDLALKIIDLLIELELFEEALELLNRIFTAENDLTPYYKTAFYSKIAGVYWKQKNYGEALKSYHKALEHFQPPSALSLSVLIRNRMGDCYRKQENHPEAYKYYQEALRLAKLAKTHSYAVESIYEMTKLAKDYGGFAAAFQGMEWCKKYGKAIAPIYAEHILRYQDDLNKRVRVSGLELDPEATKLPETYNPFEALPGFPQTLDFTSYDEANSLYQQANQEPDIDQAIGLYHQSIECAKRIGHYVIIDKALSSIATRNLARNKVEDQHMLVQIKTLQSGFVLGVLADAPHIQVKFGTALSDRLIEFSHLVTLTDEKDSPVAEEDNQTYLNRVLLLTIGAAKRIKDHFSVAKNCYLLGLIALRETDYDKAKALFSETLHYIVQNPADNLFAESIPELKARTHIGLGHTFKHSGDQPNARHHYMTALGFCDETLTDLAAQIQTELDSLSDDSPDPDNKITKTKNEFQGSRDNVEGKKGALVSGEIKETRKVISDFEGAKKLRKVLPAVTLRLVDADGGFEGVLKEYGEKLAEFQDSVGREAHPLWAPLVARDVVVKLAEQNDGEVFGSLAGVVLGGLVAHYKSLDDVMGQKIYGDLQNVYWCLHGKQRDIDWDSLSATVESDLLLDPTNLWLIHAGLLICDKRLEVEQDIEALRKLIEAQKQKYQDLLAQAHDLDSFWRQSELQRQVRDYITQKFDAGSIRGAWNVQKLYRSLKSGLEIVVDIAETVTPSTEKLLSWANKLISYAEASETQLEQADKKTAHTLFETALYYGDYRAALASCKTDSVFHTVWQQLAQAEQNAKAGKEVDLHQFPNLPAHAIERSQDLDLIESTLDRSALINIEGIPGSGKTYLAAQLALRYAGEAFIFWHQFPEGQKPNVHAAFDHLALFIETYNPRKAGLLLAVRAAKTLEEKASLLSGHMTEGRFLLFFDNFHLVMEDETASEAFETFAKQAVSPTDNVRMLTTSRRHSNWLVRMGAARLQTTGIYYEEAQAMMASMDVADKITEAELEQAYQKTGGLPQALAYFATNLKQGESAAELLDNMPEGDDSLTLGYLFEKIYEKLSPDAQTLLGYLAIQRRPVTLDYLVALAQGEVRGVKNKFGPIKKALLVEEPSKGRFALHDSLKTLALPYVDSLQKLHHRAAESFFEIDRSKEDPVTKVNVNIEIIYHLIAAQNYRSAIAYLVLLMESELPRSHAYDEINDLFDTLARNQDQLATAFHGNLFTMWARLDDEMGRPALAVIRSRYAADVFEQGGDIANAAVAFYQAGHQLLDIARLSQAEACFDKSMIYAVQTHNYEAAILAVAGKVRTLRISERYAEAERLFDDTEDDLINEATPTRLVYALYSEKAKLYANQNQARKAAQCMEKVLSRITDKTRPPEESRGLWQIDFLFEICTFYYHLGEYDRALSYLTSLAGSYDLADFPRYKSRLHTLIGELLMATHQTPLAYEHLMQALHHAERCHNPHFILPVLLLLGRLAHHTQQYEQAIEFFTSAYQIASQAKDYSAALDIREEITQVYLDTGQIGKHAESLLLGLLLSLKAKEDLRAAQFAMELGGFAEAQGATIRLDSPLPATEFDVQLDTPEGLYNVVLQVGQKLQDPGLIAAASYHLGKRHKDRGNTRLAIRHLGNAAKHASRIPDQRPSIANADELIADISKLLGELRGK